MELLHFTPGRPRRLAGRLLVTVTVLLLALSSLPLSAAAAAAPASTPPSNAVAPIGDPAAAVPSPLNTNMGWWSQEGAWHWVTFSYSGSNATTAIWLPRASFVATMVLSLGPNDPCSDCLSMGSSQQGPPVIFGGTTDKYLATAYKNLDNGPRQRGADGAWAAGAWYLNFSPSTKTFFSWTWIPDTGASMTAGMPSLLTTSAVDAGTRVFPVAGNYALTQGYGCVPYNPGYPQPASCPPADPSFHDGVDLGAAAGTPIVAAASGTVTFVGFDSPNPGANSMILIQHDGANTGYTTEYLHWEQSFVKVGEHVVAGQQIAAVGSVGYSTGPHLHFTVKDPTGGTVNPLTWLQGATVPISGGVGGSVSGSVLQWASLIQAAARQYHVPAGFIAAIMTVESDGNPGSISPVGAQGLMQVMPAELSAFGVPQAQWLDPATNILAGARYIAGTLNGGGTLQ
ncbi:MAG TPA: peptidoglycan DD-metalloendopeptidase family protein, partial [Thermomicrobiaceae bacterium]|nr:peptidoglycan DD-metalloendopeptidase family protein [Thermomicrobiaceae bacterium]